MRHESRRGQAPLEGEGGKKDGESRRDGEKNGVNDTGNLY